MALSNILLFSDLIHSSKNLDKIPSPSLSASLFPFLALLLHESSSHTYSAIPRIPITPVYIDTHNSMFTFPLSTIVPPPIPPLQMMLNSLTDSLKFIINIIRYDPWR
jgi:hypothetical protein